MWSRFAKDLRGGVSSIFALALVPMMGMIGFAVDYARLASASSHIQQAVDAAALEASKRTVLKLDPTPAQRNARARAIFDANLSNYQEAKTESFTITDSSTDLVISATASLPLYFGGFLGMDVGTVSARARSPIELSTLEIALVLDNTGSMAASGKMTNLKLAAKNLITIIEQAKNSGTLGNASFALVPFTTQVKLDTANKQATWLRFDPASPESMLRVSPGTWTGCIADRDQPYDANLSPPSPVQATAFPAAKCAVNTLSRIMPLSSDYAALRTAVDAMTPNGNTNTTIGLAWGMNVLTKGMPLADAALPFGTVRNSKVVIFLTDGTNTQNRWSTSQTAIDNRMSALCTQAKTTGVEIITIRTLDGNAGLLQQCASVPGDYYSITDASQLTPLFEKIASQLLRLRLAS